LSYGQRFNASRPARPIGRFGMDQKMNGSRLALLTSGALIEFGLK
jgi:hypothetical protein